MMLQYHSRSSFIETELAELSRRCERDLALRGGATYPDQIDQRLSQLLDFRRSLRANRDGQDTWIAGLVLLGVLVIAIIGWIADEHSWPNLIFTVFTLAVVGALLWLLRAPLGRLSRRIDNQVRSLYPDGVGPSPSLSTPAPEHAVLVDLALKMADGASRPIAVRTWLSFWPELNHAQRGRVSDSLADALVHLGDNELLAFPDDTIETMVRLVILASPFEKPSDPPQYPLNDRVVAALLIALTSLLETGPCRRYGLELFMAAGRHQSAVLSSYRVRDAAQELSDRLAPSMKARR